jgi:hypothetical protein
MVLLKSKYGSTSFRRKTRVIHDRGVTYESIEYPFNFENNFKCPVPEDVWSGLECEWFDRKNNIKYKDAFQTL